MKGGLRYVARCYGPHYLTPSAGGGRRTAAVFDLYILDRWNCWRVVFHRVAPTNPALRYRLIRARREWRRTFHDLNARTGWRA